MASYWLDEQLFVTAYICFGSLFLYAIFRTLYCAYATPLRDIPGPWLAKFTRIWLFRAINSRRFNEINIQLHKKYGPIVRIAPNEYSIDDPEATQIIYRFKDQLVKAPRYEVFGLPGVEADIFSTRDNEHNHQRRRQVLPLYSIGALSSIEHHVDDTTTAFIDIMADAASKDKVLDLAQWMQYYTADAINALTFGKPFGFLKEGTDVSGMLTVIHSLVRYAAVMGVFSEWHPLVIRLQQAISSKAETGIAPLFKFVGDCVEEWHQSSEQYKLAQEQKIHDDAPLGADFLGSLLAQSRKYPEKVKEEDTVYHLIPQIGAGGETTGIVMTAGIHFLCEYPHVLEKLRVEVDAMKRKSNNDRITLTEARECLYLQAVIKETLRLFPALGVNLPRLVPKGGLTLAGRTFPEGTVVGVNAWVAHANISVFGPDAAIFRPERWLESPEKCRIMEQYSMTFGKGPRTCIGKNIALMELEKVIAEIVTRFDISLADPERDWTVCNDWFVRQYNYNVKVKERVAPE